MATMSMFIPFSDGILAQTGYPELEPLAESLKLCIGNAGSLSKSNWGSDYAVVGNTYPIKDTLKAKGARWNADCRAWTFKTLDSLQAALLEVRG